VFSILLIYLPTLPASHAKSNFHFTYEMKGKNFNERVISNVTIVNNVYVNVVTVFNNTNIINVTVPLISLLLSSTSETINDGNIKIKHVIDVKDSLVTKIEDIFGNNNNNTFTIKLINKDSEAKFSLPNNQGYLFIPELLSKLDMIAPPPAGAPYIVGNLTFTLLDNPAANLHLFYAYVEIIISYNGDTWLMDSYSVGVKANSPYNNWWVIYDPSPIVTSSSVKFSPALEGNFYYPGVCGSMWFAFVNITVSFLSNGSITGNISYEVYNNSCLKSYGYINPGYFSGTINETAYALV